MGNEVKKSDKGSESIMTPWQLWQPHIYLVSIGLPIWSTTQSGFKRFIFKIGPLTDYADMGHTMCGQDMAQLPVDTFSLRLYLQEVKFSGFGSRGFKTTPHVPQRVCLEYYANFMTVQKTWSQVVTSLISSLIRKQMTFMKHGLPF